MINLDKRTDESNSDSVLLDYNGPLLEGTVTDLLTQAEGRLKQLDLKKSIHKKLYGVLLESLQNAHKHTADLGLEQPSSILLTQEADYFLLQVGNTLKKSSREALENKLRYINSLSKEDLQVKFREILANGVQSEIGGSGLGLMDIARRSGNKLEYQFNEIEPDVLRFTLKVKV